MTTEKNELNEYHLKDLFVGQCDHINYCIDQNKLDQFVALCGDSNPLHTDREYCQSQKLPGPLVHGWLTGAWISTFIGMRLPGKKSRFLSAKVSWPNPVFVNDEVQLRGEITSVSESTRTIELKLRAKNKQNLDVLRGIAVVEVLE